MLEAGHVVQLDRMLYTVPEHAYKNIDMPVFVEAINQLLVAEAKPVEPSVFKKRLNNQLSASYSKYFYASIARMSANQMGWFRKHNLYSSFPIPYKNLTDVVQQHCRLDQTTEQNIIALKQHIVITRDIALRTLSHWRQKI